MADKKAVYDIAIIGGGTAGLTAALYAQRAGKSAVVLEKAACGGQIVNSPRVENYPGIANVSGFEFSMNLQQQAESFGAKIVMTQVKTIREEDGVFVLETDGEEICGRAVIAATGMKHRKLGIESEQKFAGAGVSYCATCDGMFFRGRDVAVIGGGNTALQDADFLSNYCGKVYVVHRRDEFRGEQRLVENLQKKENVEFVLNALTEELTGQYAVDGILLKDRYAEKADSEGICIKRRGEMVSRGHSQLKLDVSGVFVAVGQAPENEVLASYVQLDEGGFIVAGESCKTSHPAIFAAGDCRTKDVRQLATAAADGAVAALAAVGYLAG